VGQKIKKRRYWRKKQNKAMPKKKVGIIAKLKSLLGGKNDERKTK
jgi:hypothetical protein